MTHRSAPSGPGATSPRGSVRSLGRPTWPINTPYAGGTTCCAADTKCTRYAFSSLHRGGPTSPSATRVPSQATLANDPNQQTCSSQRRPTGHLNLYFANDGFTVDAQRLRLSTGGQPVAASSKLADSEQVANLLPQGFHALLRGMHDAQANA